MNMLAFSLAQQADPDYTGNDVDQCGDHLVGNRAIEMFAELVALECAKHLQTLVDQRVPASEYPELILKPWRTQ